ncbi:hypothetical protein [Candidatus Thiosymbion oneisti]|uniref:hypothetical protein n=1 Tax=Candidatus Thiosymbion oneisti TaxID=589554 RepID=UPI00105C43E7|nr:hypothetical protein [Candidatus Thiosymbion oneisti]
MVNKGRIISVLVSTLAVLYVAGSLIVVYSCRQALEREKERVYSIADHLELWKEIMVKYNGYLDMGMIRNHPRDIYINQVEREEELLLIDPGDRFYIMFPSKLDEERKKALKRRYFSDLVLDNYFSIVTDKNGKIKEMGWDKP